jgi:hypothetical protein
VFYRPVPAVQRKGENLDQRHVPVYTRIFFVSISFSCTYIFNNGSEVAYSGIRSLIFKYCFIMIHSCDFKNNIFYFILLTILMLLLVNESDIFLRTPVSLLSIEFTTCPSLRLIHIFSWVIKNFLLVDS